MRPIFQTIRFYGSTGLNVTRHVLPGFYFPWHLHPEYELTYIVEGQSGKRFVGDHVESYENGEIVLLGKNVPHVWLSDRNETDKGGVESIVVQFRETILSPHLLESKEFERAASVLEESARGLKLVGKTRTEIGERILNLEAAAGLRRFTGLIEILDHIGKTGEYELLSSNREDYQDENAKPERIRRVDEFLMQNYQSSITVSDAAAVAHMNTSAFCRYFKKQTQTTFSRYLTELRISFACKLLISGDYPISRVCFESGFNSLSYFNRRFREIVKLTPRQYRAEFQVL